MIVLCSHEGLILVDAMRQNRRLIFSPEKSFELPVYAEQAASVLAVQGSMKAKHRRPTCDLHVLEFIDGSAYEGRETSDSSTDMDSAIESTAT